MNIKLYNTVSPPNKVTKALNLVADITGESKEEIDALNCAFKLSRGHLQGVQGSNYLYCTDTAKYYFINPDYKIENQTVTITCKVDPLMTYAAKIRQQNVTVARNANISNSYLLDNGYEMLSYKNIVTKEFPAGFDKAYDTIILMTVG